MTGPAAKSLFQCYSTSIRLKTSSIHGLDVMDGMSETRRISHAPLAAYQTCACSPSKTIATPLERRSREITHLACHAQRFVFPAELLV